MEKPYAIGLSLDDLTLLPMDDDTAHSPQGTAAAQPRPALDTRRTADRRSGDDRRSMIRFEDNRRSGLDRRAQKDAWTRGNDL